MNPTDPPGPQDVTVRTRPDATVITLTGVMDLDHVDAFRTVLSAACTGVNAPARVVIALAGLTFCDSTGLNALLQARLMCTQSGRTLTLAGPSPQLSRLLSITGADTLFDITDSVGDGTDRSATAW
ncbi:STAS domain-containing protein [Streptomyces sp. NPDC099050]|uniref:STAS domain-containing protein n=1 Tax=Streptomyces sp. NPDC099050 TaxID=3366100 RepID=UPI0038289611